MKSKLCTRRANILSIAEALPRLPGRLTHCLELTTLVSSYARLGSATVRPVAGPTGRLRKRRRPYGSLKGIQPS